MSQGEIHPSPRFIEEICQQDGHSVVMSRVPEVDHSVIPVIQSHGPLPQVFLSPNQIQQATAPRRPSHPILPKSRQATPDQSTSMNRQEKEWESAESAILKSGWLDLKKKHLLRSVWIRRYFILKSNGNLYQYKHQKKEQGDYEVVHLLLDRSKVLLVSKNQGTFDLATAKHHYHFKTTVAGDQDVTEWVNALSSVERGGVQRSEE